MTDFQARSLIFGGDNTYVSGQCPHDSGVEIKNVASQLIEMNLPRRLATRQAIHRR